MIQSLHYRYTGLQVFGELYQQVSLLLPELATVGKPGLFYGGGFEQLGVQLMGVVACGVFAFVVSYAILFIMKKAWRHSCYRRRRNHGLRYE